MKQVVVLAVVALWLVLGNVSAQSLWSVYEDNGSWKLVSDIFDYNYIVTNGVSSDRDQAFAAGYLEGALTAPLIYDTWISTLEYFYNGVFNPLAGAFIQKNDAWVRSEVLKCSSLTPESKEYAADDCDYWYQVGLTMSQLDGMVLGYNEHCDPAKALAYDLFLYMNAAADVGDILNIEDNHCSVLVKYSEQEQELYHSHTTWGHYVNMLRVFKHYTFKFNHPSTISKTVSFSSFPGTISSGDDYYITDTGLIVTETTNSVFNMSLYQYVQPETVLYWIRIVVTNRMADNGSAWVDTFGKYNSGTYNNQWQVTDTKLFTPGQPLVAGTLYILEQIPGFIVSDDMTPFLAKNGYFPSYNIPYFPFIYNMSGYPQQYNLFGDAYSYSSCPRANIFRRDQGNVVTFTDMQNIMRYNEYQTDPLSLGDPCNGISARCDLNTTTVLPFGGYDCKVSSTSLIKNMTTTALCGPTTLTQPAFSWTGPFASVPHYGQPTLFNFSFENMYPVSL